MMCMRVCEVRALCAGLVYTFLSGSGLPSFGFDYDSYGLLSLAPHVSNWTLQHCNNHVLPQAVFNGQTWSSPHTYINESRLWQTTLQEGFAPSGHNARNICPLSYEFKCTPLPWRRHAQAVTAAPGAHHSPHDSHALLVAHEL